MYSVYINSDSHFLATMLFPSSVHTQYKLLHRNMDAYPALSAFIGSLLAMLLAEVLFRLRTYQLLVPAMGGVIMPVHILGNAEELASNADGSVMSIGSVVRSATLAGITGPPSSKSHTGVVEPLC